METESKKQEPEERDLGNYINVEEDGRNKSTRRRIRNERGLLDEACQPADIAYEPQESWTLSGRRNPGPRARSRPKSRGRPWDWRTGCRGPPRPGTGTRTPPRTIVCASCAVCWQSFDWLPGPPELRPPPKLAEVVTIMEYSPMSYLHIERAFHFP